MVDVVTQAFAILFVGAILGWVFDKSVYSTFIGYLLGGLLVSLLFVNLGVDISTLFNEISFLSNLGIVIFSFEMGLLISIESILKNLNKILVIELSSYPLLWVVARVISSILGFSVVEETVLFILLMDSSASLLQALRSKSSDLSSLAILQTNFEDLAQFVAFSAIFVAQVFTVEGIVVNAFKIAGILTLLALALYKITEKIEAYILRMSLTSKLVFYLSIALLYTLITQYLNLPPLIGAFIAGVALSRCTSREDVAVLSGIRELGLLFYFSLLGSQLALVVSSVSTLHLLVIGVIIGVIGVVTRILALSLGLITSGIGSLHVLTYAVALSSISETIIVFSDILVSQGVLKSDIRTIVVVSVVTSIMASCFIYKKTPSISAIIKKIIPRRVRSTLVSFSPILLHGTDLIFELSKDIVKFLVTLLAGTYVIRILIAIHTYLPLLGLIILALSMIAYCVITVVLFARVLRKIYDRLFREITTIRRLSWRMAIMKIETTIALVLSLLLLISTLHAVVVEAGLPTQLYTLLIEVVNVTTIIILIYMALRELGRVKIPPKLRKYMEQNTWI
jgi:Kef-type K+ transport system membrane component KefB